jgi:hypothetical protein
MEYLVFVAVIQQTSWAAITVSEYPRTIFVLVLRIPFETCMGFASQIHSECLSNFEGYGMT